MKFLESIRSILNNSDVEYKVNRLRPPGSVREERFIKLCIRCSRCIDVCPYGAITRSKELSSGVGTPFIYPDINGCHLCMMCTSVCPTAAIDSNVKEMQDVKIGIAQVNEDTCLNFNYARMEDMQQESDGSGQLCNSCFNTCPLKFDAIYLKDAILPTITDKCTGCGICVERCPTKAKSISVIPIGMADSQSAGYYHYLNKGK